MITIDLTADELTVLKSLIQVAIDNGYLTDGELSEEQLDTFNSLKEKIEEI